MTQIQVCQAIFSCRRDIKTHSIIFAFSYKNVFASTKLSCNLLFLQREMITCSCKQYVKLNLEILMSISFFEDEKRVLSRRQVFFIEIGTLVARFQYSFSITQL